MPPPQNHSSWRRLLLASLIVVATTRAGAADDAAFFESKIRPLLSEHCYECHSTERKQKGGLVLDSKRGWESGGDSGAAIHPGVPDDSLLIKAVRWTDHDLRMPPEKAGGRLTDEQIADLERWVRNGATDPRTKPDAGPAQKSWAEIFAERRQWWSLQPVHAVAPPAEIDPAWSQCGSDLFLRARMQGQGIIPSPRADDRTLIRRASLVLTGLPPAPAEIDAFLAAAKENGEAAYAALIDHLLASPHFGEHWARHWLDVVRFSETHGNEWNYDVAYAWRYRDYVIRAFNDDLPYDQLVREQIAGDLLAQPRWNSAGGFNESAIGTAFYRFGEVNHDSCAKFGAIGYDIADNQLDTLTKAFQATTVACARCHDHKLDAVSTRDYHALLGVLRSSRLVQHTLDVPDANRGPIETLKSLKQEIRTELGALWRSEAQAVSATKLEALADAAKKKAPEFPDPLRVWMDAAKASPQELPEAWAKLGRNCAAAAVERKQFNEAHFTDVADFRHGLPAGWHCDGLGLRERTATAGDFAVACEGDAALKMLLPAGIHTFAVSDKLNGALRSPTLPRTHTKVSFEVVGGRFSLAHLIFNNCQLNYNHQQALHYDDWTWVTVDFPEDTEPLHPYAELLTFWDNPKFPDPLGKLGNDTENMRGPWSDYSKNPRTWWGVRRIVVHDVSEKPKDEVTHLARLFVGAAPQSREEAAARYAAVAASAVNAFAANRASDDDIRWLDWLMRRGLLSNRAAASPRLAELVARYRETESRLTQPTMMPGMADEGPGFAQPILQHGDYTKPGEPVERAYVAALTPPGFTFGFEGSGRAELARLMATADNPLTARVMVNRIWQWVFGRGLVATPDDFGHLGERPSHPELLDDLAARFVAEGWSVKRLVRALVLSRAFQSASAPSGEARQRDPRNLLLSHYPARRVEAETIRDSILTVSGRLDPQLYGPSIHPFRKEADPDKRLFAGPLDGDGRRSIYLKFQLMEAPRFLSAFNLPGGKVAEGRRDTSNVPAQSLALLNDPFVLAMADFWAARLIADGRTSIDQRIDALYREALGRPPSEADRSHCREAIHTLAQTHGVAETDILASRAVWKDAAHMMFNLKEFIFIP